MSLLLLLAAAAAQPDPRFHDLRQRIVVFCRSDQACIARQKQGAKHFLGIMAFYNAPDSVTAACMRGATRNRLTDWVRAAACMRTWSRKQPSPLRKR